MRSRLERLLAIEFAIRSGHYPSAEELCDVFSVKLRTIYEDLRILRQRLGLDIQYDRVRNGYFNADPSQKLPAFDLSGDDLILLAVACKICGSLGTSFDSLLKQILFKIGERVSSPEAQNIDKAHAIIQCGDGMGSSVSALTLVACARACVQEDRIEIALKCDTQTTPGPSVILRPVRIIEENKRWLLVGYAEPSDDLQTIGLEKIDSFRPLLQPEQQEE